MKTKNGKATFPTGMKVTPDKRRNPLIPAQQARKVGAGGTAPKGHNVKVTG